MYTFYGLVTQLFLCSLVLATEVTVAQKNASVKETNVSINFSSDDLASVFEEIEAQTNFTFVYTKNELDKKVKIDGNYSNTPLYEVLLDISKKSNIAFRQFNNNITVKNVDPKQKVKPFVVILADVDISGKIIDETGQGLPGVSIIVKENPTMGVTTNLDGNFKLSVPEASTIAISFVGYITREFTVGSQTVFDVQMELDAKQLDEIVVVGYGTQKKVNLTGAVASVSGDVFDNRPIVSVGQGLQGVIPNLNVDIRNGDPAAAIEFNIRGYESINGGAPLVLVDGVPMDLNKLNPNDIASISVLKDASAAAVYGARAAFGVVLVTTKRGKDGK